MKKFQFELEDILSVRKFQQEQAESELAKSLAVEQEIQRALDALAEYQTSIQKQMRGNTSFYDIVNATQFSGFVRNKSEMLMRRMAEAKVVSDEKRKIVKAAMQKTETLENLKKSQQKEYKIEVQKDDDNEIDDIVTSRQ
ncbi:MAG: flagellar export protein FliJ [Treponema sp.]|nr:flagellar export protein FliJ [Treponema sp.]